MFIISSYYQPGKTIIDETINSIKLFHPKERVIICDSNSPSKNYANHLLSDKVEFFDASNLRRPIGALLETYLKYPNEDYYVLMHDSSCLIADIEEFLSYESEMVTFFYTNKPVSTIPEYNRKRFFDWMEETFSKIKYELSTDFREDGTYCVSVGCMGIYKNSLLKKFVEKGLYENMNTFSFDDFSWSERAIGYIAKLENINLQVNSIIKTDILPQWNEMQIGRLPYIKKICAGR